MPDCVFADLEMVYVVALLNTFAFGFTLTFFQVTVNIAAPEAVSKPDKVIVLPLTVNFWLVRGSTLPVVLNVKL